MQAIKYIDELSPSASWPRPRIGISRCLLGHKVRFDGGHKRDQWIMNTLANYVDFFPICPEIECGMPVPREALRLVGDVKKPEETRLVAARSGEDWTDTMLSWADTRLKELENERLCGYVFKRASPSNGMERVKVYPTQKNESQRKHNVPQNKGIGIFARAFMTHFPHTPVEEEGRLRDIGLRERFMERIFIMQRWQDCIQSLHLIDSSNVFSKSTSLGALLHFHTRHKLLLLSHSPSHYRAMGRLVANSEYYSPENLIRDYEKLLNDALALHATPAKHAHVMQYVLGYFKKDLSASEKGELLEYIILYKNKQIPLIIPMTLIIHYIKKYQSEYLAMQYYINPYPIELQLRNYII